MNAARMTGKVQMTKEEWFRGVVISIRIETNFPRKRKNPRACPLNDVAWLSMVIKQTKPSIPFEKHIPKMVTIDIDI